MKVKSKMGYFRNNLYDFDSSILALKPIFYLRFQLKPTETGDNKDDNFANPLHPAIPDANDAEY
jgi:hypothetical protein